MNIRLPSLHTRKSIARTFFRLQTDAIRDALEADSFDQNTRLPALAEQTPWMRTNLKFGGVKEIPLEKIVGTFNRNRGFDHKFRPVKRSRQERWTYVYRTFKKDGLTPIVVHKVGDGYYVEDGHQRISVARSLGRTSIQAEIWEYAVPQAQSKACQYERCAGRSSTEAYAI